MGKTMPEYIMGADYDSYDGNYHGSAFADNKPDYSEADGRRQVVFKAYVINQIDGAHTYNLLGKL